MPAAINEDGTNDTVVARGSSNAFATVAGTTGDHTANDQVLIFTLTSLLRVQVRVRKNSQCI